VAGAQEDSHMSKTRRSTNTESSDLLFGTRAIGRYLGLSERQARRRIEAGVVPTFQLGGIHCARKSTLEQRLAALEAESVAGRGVDAA
jgi:chorismate-pyruvate lyase